MPIRNWKAANRHCVDLIGEALLCRPPFPKQSRAALEKQSATHMGYANSGRRQPPLNAPDGGKQDAVG